MGVGVGVGVGVEVGLGVGVGVGVHAQDIPKGFVMAPIWFHLSLYSIIYSHEFLVNIPFNLISSSLVDKSSASSDMSRISSASFGIQIM